MYVVCVTFTIHPGKLDAFMPLVLAQAANSLRIDSQCHRFDVCLGEEDEVFLYEIYTDENAFKSHLETPHFLDFEGGTRELINTKTVRTYRLTEQ